MPAKAARHVEVWRAEEGGGEMTKVLETDSCEVLDTDYFTFWPLAYADFAIDDVRIVSSDLYTVTAFEYSDANEQTKMRTFDTETDYTDTAFAYDDWGRMTARTMGGHTATIRSPVGTTWTIAQEELLGLAIERTNSPVGTSERCLKRYGAEYARNNP